MTGGTRTRALRLMVRLAIIAIVVGFALPAEAQRRRRRNHSRKTTIKKKKPPKPTPWSVGVSAKQQRVAQKLFGEGVVLQSKERYRDALAKYNQAIKHWDNPGIRLNMAEALFHLDRPIEAHRNLELALRYGSAPHQPRAYKRALIRKKQLARQLASITVKSKQAGVSISLNGKRLFVGPGEHSEILLPGRHQVVASKRGFMTETKFVAAFPGRPTVVELRLVPMGRIRTTTRRRWRRWIPWTVITAGTIVGLAGLPVFLQADSDFDSYKQALEDSCGETACETVPALAQQFHRRAKRANMVAIGLFVTGGTVLAIGALLSILNQVKVVLLRKNEGSSAKTSFRPVVRDDLVGLSVSRSF